jgi:peptidoglycan/LPS O-acetylase OafA/YrhL
LAAGPDHPYLERRAEREASLGDRDNALEALRGVAAFCVMFWHTLLAFFPNRSGIFPGFPADDAISGSLLFAFFNPTAAVTFFFVLSGYVLTRRYFVTGDSTALLATAIRRWPRLAGPVLVVVLASWAMFTLQLYSFAAAAELTKSPWLKAFGYAFDVPFEPRFLDALLQGSVYTFFRGDWSYDSPMWTMRYEFIGSFIAFGLAGVLGTQSKPWARICLILIVVFLVRIMGQHWYVGFLAGVALAAVLPLRPIRLSLPVSILGLAVSFYLVGYSGVDRGAFHLLFMVLSKPPSPNYLSIVAAVILMVCVLLNERVHAAFANRIGTFLGWISFPLYLLHVPIICSAGAATYVWAAHRFPDESAFLAAFVTFGVTIIAAIPLAYFNDRWRDLLRVAIRPSAPKPT